MIKRRITNSKITYWLVRGSRSVAPFLIYYRLLKLGHRAVLKLVLYVNNKVIHLTTQYIHLIFAP